MKRPAKTRGETLAIKRAIAIVGSTHKLGKAIGVPQRSVANWSKNVRVRPEACAAIEQATEGKVSRRDLRPDLFGSDK